MGEVPQSGGESLFSLKTILCQELSQMKVCYSVFIGLCDEWSHRNDILGIVVLDGMQIAKFPFTCGFICNKVGGLYVNALTLWLIAYKVYLSRLKHAYRYLVAQTNEVVVDDIFDSFLYVAFTCATSKCIAYAIVFEVEFVIALKQTFAMDVKSVCLVKYVGIA